MKVTDSKSVTRYRDINQLLSTFVKRIQSILGDNVIGVYLFGSLTYGDFKQSRSDIELMVVVEQPLSRSQIAGIELLHIEIENLFPDWYQRIEASYTPLSMLSNVLPPKNTRPYYGEGKMWPEAIYGNEWIINLYLIYTYGLTLIGSDFKSLIKPVKIRELQQAAARDLFEEWEPKLSEPEWLNNPHYQSYLVLNLSRILYTVMESDARSKKIAVEWVKKTYPQWIKLITVAENWRFGREMKLQELSLDYLRFVINKVRNSGILNQS